MAILPDSCHFWTPKNHIFFQKTRKKSRKNRDFFTRFFRFFGFWILEIRARPTRDFAIFGGFGTPKMTQNLAKTRPKIWLIFFMVFSKTMGNPASSDFQIPNFWPKNGSKNREKMGHFKMMSFRFLAPFCICSYPNSHFFTFLRFFDFLGPEKWPIFRPIFFGFWELGPKPPFFEPQISGTVMDLSKPSQKWVHFWEPQKWPKMTQKLKKNLACFF